MTANSQQETKEKEERDKQEKAEKEERDKQEKAASAEQQKEEKEQIERNERETEEKVEQYQKWLMQISENMTRMNQNIVPQSIIHTNVSAPSLSKLTTNSTQMIKITPQNCGRQKD